MELLLLLACAVIVIGIDVRVWRTLTPSVIAILPTTLVVLVAALVTPSMGFFRPSPQIYIAIGLLFASGCLGSMLAASVVQRVEETFRATSFREGDTRLLATLLGTACVALAFYMFRAYQRVGNMYEEEFSNVLAGGVAGHLGLFIMLGVPILVLHRRRGSWLTFCIIVAALLLLLLRQVKSWIVIPIVFTSLLLFYLGRLGSARATLIKLALIAGALIGVFFLVYLLWVFAYNDFDMGMDQVTDSIEWIAVHFLGYLVSGVIAFSEQSTRGALLDHNDPFYLVGTLRNLVSVAQGEGIRSAVGDTFLQISVDHDFAANVFSMWGTLVQRAGAWAFPIYGFFIFALMLLLQASRRHRYALYLYCFLVSFLAVAWFEYYYYHANVYFAPFWLAAISYLVAPNRSRGSANGRVRSDFS